MTTDSHVHVGWYSDGYHSPAEVLQAEREAGVNEMCVSSTSTCAGLYKLVVKEMQGLVRLGGASVHPILWLTPEMFRSYKLRFMLHSKVRWQGVKIHSESHPEWAHNAALARKAAMLANVLGVPMLIHTGQFEWSQANVFRYLIEENPNQIFVLAHGRPVEQTMEILKSFPNVYVDTAFMAKEQLSVFLEAGMQSRLLFGTDAPINLFYGSNRPTSTFIKEHLGELKSLVPAEDFEAIVSRCPYHETNVKPKIKRLWNT